MTTPTARSSWDRALSVTLVIFALAATWSIAIAQIGIVATAILVAARWLVRHRDGDGNGRPLPAMMIAIGAYLFVQALAIPFGIHPGRSLGAYAGSWILLFPLVFWLALEDEAVRRHAYRALLIGATLAGIYGIIQHVQGIDWLHGGARLEPRGERFMVVGNFGHLTYAGVLLPIFFFVIGYAFDRAGIRRAAWIGSAAVIGGGLLFSYARTAWVGVAVGLGMLALAAPWRARGLAAIPLAAAAVIVARDSALLARVTSIASITDLPRWRLWETAVRIVRDHPVGGAGLGSFPALFPTYKVPGEYMATGNPHSDILNTAVETGIVGALVWISIWVAFFLATRGGATRPDRRWTVVGMRTGVAALLVAGLGECFSTNEEVAQVWFFFLAAALVETSRPRAGADGHPDPRCVGE